MATELTDDYRLVGAVLENRYRIDSIVAQGGFGVVYRGAQIALERPIAVKVLRVPRDLTETQAAEVYALFYREGLTTARITHPSIVQTIDQGVSEMPSGQKAPWMVLEWLNGYTLREHLAQQGGAPYSSHAALALLRPVLEGLAHAHEHGVAHRDIKPANIMAVSMRGGKITLRLMDFGIAKLMEDGERPRSGGTRTASPFSPFSPAYASPEQVGATHSGPWTDVHAMGLLFTELLTGRQPYVNSPSKRIQWLMEVVNDERPTPAKHGIDVGPWEPVLARAMHRHPKERYPNAGEFLAALESTLPSAAVVVRGPDPVDVTGQTRPSFEHPSNSTATQITSTPSSYISPGTVPTLVTSPAQAPPAPYPESLPGQVHPAPYRESLPHGHTPAPLVTAAVLPAPPPSPRRTFAIIAGVVAILAGIGGGAALALSSRRAAVRAAVHATALGVTSPQPTPPLTALAPPPAPTTAAIQPVLAAPTPAPVVSPVAPTQNVPDARVAQGSVAPAEPSTMTEQPRRAPSSAPTVHVTHAPATAQPRPTRTHPAIPVI